MYMVYAGYGKDFRAWRSNMLAWESGARNRNARGGPAAPGLSTANGLLACIAALF